MSRLPVWTPDRVSRDWDRAGLPWRKGGLGAWHSVQEEAAAAKPPQGAAHCPALPEPSCGDRMLCPQMEPRLLSLQQCLEARVHPGGSRQRPCLA